MNEEYGIILSENSQIDLNSPFAPGTYVELKLKDENDENLNWGFVECDSWEKKEALLNSNYPINLDNIQHLVENNSANSKYNVKYENNTLAFSLPITRSNEPTEDIKNYQYYIVVFAYSSKKALPNENDPKIIIDMSFRVGVGKDESVRETKRKSQQALYNQASVGSIEDWNKLQCICNVNEAVEFLVANKNAVGQDYDEVVENFLTYCKTHPQLAGKIAYIYYRFDLADEEFIESVVRDKGEYVRDREEYINKICEVFNNQFYNSSDFSHIFSTNQYTFKEAYENLFSSSSDQENIIEKRKDFVKIFIEALCEKKNLNLKLDRVDFESNYKPEDVNEKTLQEIANNGITNGFYDRGVITLDELPFYCGGDDFNDRSKYPNCSDDERKFLTKFMIFGYIITIIFHELRHCYIQTHYNPYNQVNMSVLKQYLYWNDWLYIFSDDTNIFNAFYKICNNKDSSNVGCIFNWRQNAYEIQPNERDARYVATQITKKLQL